MLADMGVPLALVTGDDRLGEAIDDRFPDTQFVETKRTRGARAATSRDPDAVQQALTDAAAAGAADIPPCRCHWTSMKPTDVSVRFDSPQHAQLAALWPSVDRDEDSRVVTHRADDIRSMCQFVQATAAVHPRS